MTRALTAICCLSLLLGVSASSAPQQTAAEKQILQILREVEAARPKKDVSVFQRHVADDYTSVSSRGTQSTRAELIAGVQRDDFSKYVLDNLKVRVYGDTAVATGRATYTATFEGVKYTDRQVLFTEIYVRRTGQWQSVAVQSTVVAAQQK